MIIRAVRPSEYEAAGELTVEAYRTLGDAGDEFYDRDLRDIAGRRDSSEILVAEIGGRVIGCVTFVDGLKTLSDVDDPDAATVRMLGVAAEARGRGVRQLCSRRDDPPLRWNERWDSRERHHRITSAGARASSPRRCCRGRPLARSGCPGSRPR